MTDFFEFDSNDRPGDQISLLMRWQEKKKTNFRNYFNQFHLSSTLEKYELYVLYVSRDVHIMPFAKSTQTFTIFQNNYVSNWEYVQNGFAHRCNIDDATKFNNRSKFKYHYTDDQPRVSRWVCIRCWDHSCREEGQGVWIVLLCGNFPFNFTIICMLKVLTFLFFPPFFSALTNQWVGGLSIYVFCSFTHTTYIGKRNLLESFVEKCFTKMLYITLVRKWK